MGDTRVMLSPRSGRMKTSFIPAADADRQVAHIRDLILAQAREDADKMGEKTEEDYAHEKSRLMDEEMKQIKKEYERKHQRVFSDQKIDAAKNLSRCRLSILSAQSAIVDQMLVDAAVEIEKVSGDRSTYAKLLEGLLVQGLEKMMELSVDVRCRENDLAAVEAAIPGATEAFLKLHGKPGAQMNVQVDKDNFLRDQMGGEKMSGGVVLVNKTGKVVVDNTFNARLQIAAEQLLPEIKETLY